jgi:hypothetical protein
MDCWLAIGETIRKAGLELYSEKIAQHHVQPTLPHRDISKSLCTQLRFQLTGFKGKIK